MAETATVQIAMPEMGESVTEGIVLEWHVAEGDFVSEGDTVVGVSTDKVDAEVPAPASGVITKLLVSVDDEVPVGAPLAEMEPGDEDSAIAGQTPAAPGREAEEAAADGEALPPPDDDRNLTPSEEGGGPGATAQGSDGGTSAGDGDSQD